MKLMSNDMIKRMMENNESGIFHIPNSAIPQDSVYITDPNGVSDYLPRIIDADTGINVSEVLFDGMMRGIAIVTAKDLIEAIYASANSNTDE